MTLLEFQTVLLDLGVSCRIHCIGAMGWSVTLSWEGSDSSVISTGPDLETAVHDAIHGVRSVRPLTREEREQLTRTLATLESFRGR